MAVFYAFASSSYAVFLLTHRDTLTVFLSFFFVNAVSVVRSFLIDTQGISARFGLACLFSLNSLSLRAQIDIYIYCIYILCLLLFLQAFNVQFFFLLLSGTLTRSRTHIYFRNMKVVA